ncbi:hypothetical protein ACFQ7B_32520 [Streptomyces erythrochromogenes]|uniref:hypothetical protein n=1 Tax=Streptomyces erythrochromogenes TaxID=285574 RepID=UPI00367AD494
MLKERKDLRAGMSLDSLSEIPDDLAKRVIDALKGHPELTTTEIKRKLRENLKQDALKARGRDLFGPYGMPLLDIPGGRKLGWRYENLRVMVRLSRCGKAKSTPLLKRTVATSSSRNNSETSNTTDTRGPTLTAGLSTATPPVNASLGATYKVEKTRSRGVTETNDQSRSVTDEGFMHYDFPVRVEIWVEWDKEATTNLSYLAGAGQPHKSVVVAGNEDILARAQILWPMEFFEAYMRDNESSAWQPTQ